MNRFTSPVALLAIFLATGCATVSPSTDASAGAIRAAEEVGAKRVPQAALHLQLALEQSERAKGLIAAGDTAGATSLLSRAQADAELAVALVRESDDRAAAEQAVDSVKRLRASYQ